MKNFIKRSDVRAREHRKPSSLSGKINFIALLFFVFLILIPDMTGAVESIYISNKSESVVFRLDLFGKDEAYWYNDVDDIVYYSANDFDTAIIDAILPSLEYWVNVLMPEGVPFTPVIVRSAIEPFDDFNAMAFFFHSEVTQRGRVYEALVGGEDLSLEPSCLDFDPLLGAHTLVVYNNYPFDTQPNSQVPETPASITPVVIHELGHSLGIDGDNPEFSQYLVEDPPVDPDIGTMYFIGPNALEVFGDRVPMAHVSLDESSHFGVRNGLMTHAQIINYPMFMEVEMASLQDLGFPIDRRAFFGLSLYPTEEKITDGKTFVLQDEGAYDDFYENQAKPTPSKTIVNNLGFF
ncbi:MAG: hypothetical protein LBF22_12935, partial [Deltaproteobacteria bacterium]|nr:hypothetical protein [Deltaproteobacteria bacterium]